MENCDEATHRGAGVPLAICHRQQHAFDHRLLALRILSRSCWLCGWCYFYQPSSCTMLPLSYEAATRRHLSLLAASHTQCVATQCWLWPQQARMPYDANVDPLTAVVVDLDPKHHCSHVPQEGCVATHCIEFGPQRTRTTQSRSIQRSRPESCS